MFSLFKKWNQLVARLDALTKSHTELLNYFDNDSGAISVLAKRIDALEDKNKSCTEPLPQDRDMAHFLERVNLLEPRFTKIEHDFARKASMRDLDLVQKTVLDLMNAVLQFKNQYKDNLVPKAQLRSFVRQVVKDEAKRKTPAKKKSAIKKPRKKK